MRKIGRRVGIGMIAMALLASCGKAPPAGNAADANDTGETSNLSFAANVGANALPKDVNKLPLKELMGHVMQYGGDGIWKRQGYIIDEKGERSLFPKNDEEWVDAESAALTLAELTNILLLPGRKVDDPKWDEAVAGVRRIALKAAAAAEKHDEDAFFTAGGELDVACENCHVQFAPWSAKPGSKHVPDVGKQGS